jgi:hypothetical protein
VTKLTAILVLAVAGSVAARADFSYTMTMKNAGGMMSAAGGSSDHTFLKGDKMRLDHGNTSTILDLSAQTVTQINHTQKTYTVAPFGQFAAAPGQADVDMKIDVQETGQHRTIGGFDCHQVVVTMDVDSPQMGQPGGATKMHMTMDLWVSPDVPGYREMRAFYQRMATGPGWAALTHGGGQGMQKAMAEIQRKMSGMNGVPVLQVMKMSMPGNSAQAAQMAQARARLEAMKAQGGEQAKMADKILATMPGGSGGNLIEMTIESSGFSTDTVPASQFAPPAEYRKTASN